MSEKKDKEWEQQKKDDLLRNVLPQNNNVQEMFLCNAKTDSTGLTTYVPYDWDECDCAERCPKCGKRKRKIYPTWPNTTPVFTCSH